MSDQTVTQSATQTTVTVETPAHEQRTTLHVVEMVPAHNPREGDPHYRIFNQTHARLVKQGLMKCWIGNGDCAGDLELHHNAVEFSLQNGVDLSKFEEAYPDFTGKSDEEFKEWIEGPGNLLVLCRMHHIGILGVHCIPDPLWHPQKFWKDGMVAPAHIETQAATKTTVTVTTDEPGAAKVPIPSQE